MYNESNLWANDTALLQLPLWRVGPQQRVESHQSKKVMLLGDHLSEVGGNQEGYIPSFPPSFALFSHLIFQPSDIELGYSGTLPERCGAYWSKQIERCTRGHVDGSLFRGEGKFGKGDRNGFPKVSCFTPHIQDIFCKEANGLSIQILRAPMALCFSGSLSFV